MTDQKEAYFWVMTVVEEPEAEAEPDPGDAFGNLMGEGAGAGAGPVGSKGVISAAKALAERAKCKVQPVKVSVQTVEENLRQMLTQLGGMLQRVQEDVKAVGGMELDEVEVQVEISGSGEVGFMGTGVEAGSRGAIVLKFKRGGMASD